MSTVHVLTIDTRHGDRLVSVHPTYEGASLELAAYVDEWWADEGFPIEDKPDDKDEMVEAYFAGLMHEYWNIDEAILHPE